MSANIYQEISCQWISSPVEVLVGSSWVIIVYYIQWCCIWGCYSSIRFLLVPAEWSAIKNVSKNGCMTSAAPKSSIIIVIMLFSLSQSFALAVTLSTSNTLSPAFDSNHHVNGMNVHDPCGPSLGWTIKQHQRCGPWQSATLCGCIIISQMAWLVSLPLIYWPRQALWSLWFALHSCLGLSSLCTWPQTSGRAENSEMEGRVRQGKFLGFWMNPHHDCVSPHYGYVRPQFPVVFENPFHTVYSDGKENSITNMICNPIMGQLEMKQEGLILCILQMVRIWER